MRSEPERGPAATSPRRDTPWQPIDWIEPEAAFLAFAGAELAFLDSRGPIGPRSRYSLLAPCPFRVLQASDAGVFRDGVAVFGNAFAALACELAGVAEPPVPGPVPFAPGAAIGFIGYELGSAWHPAPCHPRPPDQPDMAFGFHRTLLAFDRLRREAWLACPRDDDRAAILRAVARPPSRRPAPALRWRQETARAEHEARVRRARAYIEAGDIYQANITCRFTAERPTGLRAADLHVALRDASPAPFGAYLDFGPDLAIASASPERFVRLARDGRIEARPIKGTRPRGADPAGDAALAGELLASAKDRAENLMIVDLLRHDIGRVAEIGSIGVPSLCGLESFANVHHLVSAIEAQLRPGLGAVDLLRALHPGGSVTGAPKRRAMQIIAELESCARGPYCGAAVRIGFDGAMDSSILIRTLITRADGVAAHAGGGIVADSDPADEYAEMMVKAAPLLRAFGDVG